MLTPQNNALLDKDEQDEQEEQDGYVMVVPLRREEDFLKNLKNLHISEFSYIIRGEYLIYKIFDEVSTNTKVLWNQVQELLLVSA